MGFQYEDLEPPEVAALALEYLRSAAQWLEEAEAGAIPDEVQRVLSSAGRSTRDFHDAIRARVLDRYGDEVPEARRLSHRLRRRPDLVSYDDLALEPASGALGLLEVASAEEESAYQFFVESQADTEDPWLRDLFAELARHTRSVVLYLEAERETLAEAEGRG